MHNRTDESTDFVEFLLSEVNYIELLRPTDSSAKVPAYHTTHGSFLALSTIKDISMAYEDKGFMKYDQSNVINSSRIKDRVVQHKGTKVIFHDGSYVIVRKKYK